MVVKSKEYFEKTRHMKKTTNIRNTFYVDKEIQYIMKEFYQIKEIILLNRICNVTLSISRRLK